MNEIYSYGLLTCATIMFGFMFFFSDMFRKNYGSGLKPSLIVNLGGSAFGLLVLLLIKGFVFEFSVFALIMSMVSTVNNLLFSLCSLKALSKINLSLYSLFTMLGGMILPFLSGILFHNELFTLNKLICIIVIILALSLTVEKGKKSSGTLYYMGIFVFNGMSAVIAKLYQALPFSKISSAGYSILKTVVTILICAILLLFVKGDKKKINWKVIVAMAGNGTLSHTANWLVLVALYTLPASVQYPFITGGTMIVSTVISFFGNKKPKPKEVFAVALSFIGILLLIYIPEINLIK
ncbi:MAG: hypothetical protein IKD04_05750 [Clostridia bacterium]|nr:hypothetical protein [Clostridia bacterium]